MTELCFHCHETIPDNLNITLEWRGKVRNFCCHGCEAVASTIIQNNLDEYYQFRTEVSVKPEELIPQELRDLELLDDAIIQQTFVRHSNDLSTAELGVEGITCAACSWLIESRLLAEPGVSQVQVNPVTHRLTIQWDDQLASLSELIKKLLTLGYKAYPFQQNHYEKSVRKENRNYLIRLGIAGLGMMQVMMFALGLYIGEGNDMQSEHQSFLHWVSGLVATPIVFYSAFPFFRNAWFGLKQKHLVMDVPVVIAVSVAYCTSVYATITNSGQVYFDSISMFIFFLLVGRYLEHRVRVKAIMATQTQRQLLPLSVSKFENDSTVDIPLHQIKAGDQLIIRQGETIPVDGKIISGHSYVNESLLTGESKPVKKVNGDRALAGSVNQSQTLTLETTAIGESTYLAALQKMTEQATSEKPAIGLLADKIAHWFVFGILFIVTLVFITWLQIDSEKALWVAISVLVVSCPCALSLATPTALTMGAHHLGKRGLLAIKPHTLQTLSEIDTVVFDKTGTLTEGAFELMNIEILDHSLSRQTIVNIAATLERHQTHPIANAILSEPHEYLNIQSIEYHAGLGVSGRDTQHSYRIGKPEFCGIEDLQQIPDSFVNIHLSIDDKPAAKLKFHDPLKQSALAAVRQLKSQNIETAIVSGDQYNNARLAGNQLGIKNVYGDQSPEQKAEIIKQLKSNSRIVAMVGDGINDSLVLAKADLGIAIDTAADITQINGDAVMTTKALTSIPQALTIAKKTQTIIRQNLIWALGYNLMAIPFAAMGWVPPWLAAIGMTLSSLLVVLNALRLRQ